MSAKYGNYNDDEIELKGTRKSPGSKRSKPLKKEVEKQLIEEAEYQGFSSYEELNRYCEELDFKNLKDEEASGDAEDLNGIKGVSYSVRW